MKRWITVLSVCVASFLGATTAGAGITIIGGHSCGDWVARKSDHYAELAQVSWLGGLLSGVALGTDVDFLAQTDAESIYLWMDNYCKAHPLDKVVQGADELAAELMKRMHK